MSRRVGFVGLWVLSVCLAARHTWESAKVNSEMRRLVRCARISGLFQSAVVVVLVAAVVPGVSCAWAAEDEAGAIPPEWKILPTPRYVDYGAPEAFLTLGKVAIVRREGSPYQTVRNDADELAGSSTITEEELTAILREKGVLDVTSRPDDAASYEDYDTLVLLGMPKYNVVSKRYFDAMGLGFDRWDDANTPEDDFTQWSDLGGEGYVLKAGHADGKNVVLMAGYDRDAPDAPFRGAGTFYALQSLRQLVVVRDGIPQVKVAEVVDKPLLPYRGCMSGFSPDEDQQRRDIAIMPRIKANMNVYWYGNALAGYNGEAASRFRYPWRPDQLDCYRQFGKYCRERFVTMVFCMNPDHYNVAWATAKTFNGEERDPLHYDPDYTVEPEFKKLWADLGYAVENDIDILAAKFAQLHEAVPGAVLQMMNEDDGFGLIHEDDKQRYHTDTGDPALDAVNYGKARAEVLVALYNRIQALCPTSPDLMPLCPPGQLAYQHVLNRDEGHNRAFLKALGETLRTHGLAEVFPIITTGGGTAAEVVTGQTIDDFKEWAAGAPVQLHDNNFPHGFHVGAYETDPNGPRSPLQIDPEYPAGYRDKHLYSRLWGVVWNGTTDQHVLAWCESEFMWNMLALERSELNALAARKVSTAESYPLVKSLYEEFDAPACYLPDCQPPYRLLTVSDTVVFPSDNWVYEIAYTDGMRVEAQRLRRKLSGLVPKLDAEWENAFEKSASLDVFGHTPIAFCSIYLAYGYLEGWATEPETDRLDGAALRDLYLEADDIQERYFAGPERIPGHWNVLHNFYSGKLRFIYTAGEFKAAPKTPEEAGRYLDIWSKGLAGRFFEPLAAVEPGRLPDGDAALLEGWGSAGNLEGDTHRTVTERAVLALDLPADSPILIRAHIGTDTAALTGGTPITLSLGDVTHETAVCKPRWLNWLVPAGTDANGLVISAGAPVHVYAVEVYRSVAETAPE